MAEVSATTGRPGRTTALFPGAFRPPHINHLQTVRRLAGRSDIDEVVVIITNRWRAVPGSDKVLGPKLALDIWSIYLANNPKVRVEVADGSAVALALAHVDRADDGDRVLLVVGSKEAAEGRGRFAKLRDRAPRAGVRVEIVTGAPDVRPVSATDLRRALGAGEQGRDRFVAGLPTSLDESQQQAIWDLCRQAMITERDVTVERIAAVLGANDLPVVDQIRPATAPKRDLLHRATVAEQGPVYIKYANDTVSSARFDADGPKPRRRLKAEREALTCLNRAVGPEGPTVFDVAVPEVVCFDRGAKTLVLTEVCPGGRTLGDDLTAGRFDPVVSAALARFLACMHAAVPREPLWDDQAADLSRWRAALAVAITDSRDLSSLGSVAASAFRSLAPVLRHASDTARAPGLHHLDLRPQQVLLAGGQLAVIDFERAANVGDPAFDLGCLLGHYLVAGLRRGSGERAAPESCRAAVESAVATYARAVGDRWAEMEGRVVGFAGMVLLGSTVGGGGHLGMRDVLIERALGLVHTGCQPDGPPASTALGLALTTTPAASSAR